VLGHYQLLPCTMRSAAVRPALFKSQKRNELSHLAVNGCMASVAQCE
jgi:hypothetical protein